MSDEQGVLAVESVGVATGYVCVLTLDGDRLVELNAETAAAYCAELAWVVACAEHDAGVFSQLTKDVELNLPEVGKIMRHLRNSRRPVLAAATAPLEFVPIVSHRDQRPLVHGKVGKTQWSWELSDARQHCQQVLEVAVGVALDANYRQAMRTLVGLDDERARLMVARLKPHLVPFS